MKNPLLNFSNKRRLIKINLSTFMSKDSQSKSSESVDAILKQIKEFTENDTYSTSSTPLEDPKRLIEDITITSSVSENNQLSNDFSNDDLKISSEEIDPDLQYYLSKMSKMSGHDIDNLSDAAREFQSMKFDSDSNNEDIQIDPNEYLNLFNDRLNVETSSLDDVMGMVELMQNEKMQDNFITQPSDPVDYFPNDEDIYIGKNDFLSDDFSLNERERKINDIISKQNQRNKSSLRKSQQKLLSKPSFNTDTTKTTSENYNQNDIGSSNSVKFDDVVQNPIPPSSDSKEINTTSTKIINQSVNDQKIDVKEDFIVEEEEEDIDNVSENKESITKQIQSNSFSNSSPKTISSKSSSKSASFTHMATNPIRNSTTSNSQTQSTPISTPDSFTNKQTKDQAPIPNQSNPSLSKTPIQRPSSRKNNEEETEEDIFSFSSKGKINSNDNDLDEEIRKNNNSISQLITSSFKSSSNKNNNNSFLSNKNEKEDVIDIIKNVNEELERNKIDQNDSEAFEIEDEKSPQINQRYKSSLSQSIQHNSNSNEPKPNTNSNSYSYTPHISNRPRKSINSNRTNTNSLNKNNNGYNSEIFDDSNNSEDLNIFDFDDNRSYTGHHVSSSSNPRPAISSSSYFRDSQKNRKNQQKQQNSYVNNNEVNSRRRQQLTEDDFQKAELIESNRKLRSENELLKQKVSELETENEHLKYSSVTSNERASSLEHENEKLSSQLSLQAAQVERLKTSKENVQKAYTEIEGLLSNQTSEAQKLAKQREQLLQMLQRQTTICERYEKLLEDAQNLKNKMNQNNENLSSNSISSSSIQNQQNGNFFNSQQNPNFLQQQQMFVPYQNFNQQQNFIQNQDLNDSSQNSIVYKNELIQPKVPDFNDLLGQICQSVTDIFGIDDENENDDDSENSLTAILKEIKELKDASNIPPNSRIANIISFLSCKVKEDKEDLQSCKTKRSILRQKLNDSQNRELQVLQILEGELRFLQHLAHSTDIQNVVFYRPTIGKSLSLNKESQSELMRHCVSVQKFIDDSIGFYSKEQLTSLANGIFSNDNRNNGKNKKASEVEKNTVERVFNLFHSDDFEKGIQYMLSFISSRVLNETETDKNPSDFGDSMNYRQVSDLFFAQSIMNDILQNHIIDLQSQVVYANHQNQKLQIELRDQDDTKAALEYATKEIRHFQRKDEKLLKLITRALEIPKQLNPNSNDNENEIDEEDKSDDRKSRPNKSGRKRSSSVNNNKRSLSASSSSSQFSEQLSDSNVPPKIRSKGRSSSVQNDSRNSKKHSKKSDKDLTALLTTFIKKFYEINQSLVEKESELKKVVGGIEKVQNGYKKKIEKRSKIIRDLKKVVSSQSKEIESLKTETVQAQKKCTDENKQKELKIGSLKAVLQGIHNLRDDLKKMVVKIYKEHQNQIQKLRNDWNNMITNYEHSYETSSRSRESLSLLEQETNVLRNRIISDQRSFKKTVTALQKKCQTFRVQYEALTTDVRSLRAENERLTSEHQNALSGLEHAKAELEAAMTEKKALEVKMKASEERFDCERKTLQSQLAAKVMSMQADVSSQLKNEQENRMQELQQIIQLASPFINIKSKMNDTLFNSPLNVVKSLCNVISELIESHKKAQAEASDASSARALLSLSQGSPLCPAISNILREVREIRSKLEKVKKGEKESSFQLEKLERNIASMQSNSNDGNSFDWENWARRVISGISDSNVQTVSIENIRKLIEEAVLASVSQRRLIFMLRSLREEKKALIKFDKTILNSNSSLSLSSPSWGAVVAVYASIRRMQQLAGCMPIQMRKYTDNGRMSIINDDERRKKKNNKRNRRNDEDEFIDDYDGYNRSFSLKNKSNNKSRHRRRNNYDDDDEFDNRNRNRSRNNNNNNNDDYDYDDQYDDYYNNQKKSRRKYK